jgi:uncharacterized protein YegP (UPF0339 family)
MATATKKVRPARPVDRRPHGAESAGLDYIVYQDNGGNYHWEIVDGSGQSLTHSGGFASHDDAERAARYVYRGAQSARFEGDDVAEERQTVVV